MAVLPGPSLMDEIDRFLTGCSDTARQKTLDAQGNLESRGEGVSSPHFASAELVQGVCDFTTIVDHPRSDTVGEPCYASLLEWENAPNLCSMKEFANGITSRDAWFSLAKNNRAPVLFDREVELHIWIRRMDHLNEWLHVRVIRVSHDPFC